MKVLVCGGRDYIDKLAIWAVLHEIQAGSPITHLIHGGARGADALAASWAITTNGVQEVRCDANWDRVGRSKMSIIIDRRIAVSTGAMRRDDSW